MQPNSNHATPAKPAGKNRILVIGLDSAEPSLIQRWANEGRLPFLASLIEKGIWTTLISTTGLLDSPWLSFNTGVNPGKHAYYNPIQLKRGTTDLIRVNARSARYLPFWWLLRSCGKKVAIFDVPKTYPVATVDGVQISAWGEHYPLVETSSLPVRAAEEIAARFGRYRHPKEIIKPRRISQETRIQDTLLSNIDTKLEAVQFLMDQDDWDLFITVFGESHYAGHQFFHHWEKRHWSYDPRNSYGLEEALPNVYARLDSALAALLKSVSDQVSVFIVSVHGIATNYSANQVMPVVLEKLGFQARTNTENKDGFSTLLHLTSGFRNLFPGIVRDFINDHIVPQSFHDRTLFRDFDCIDWKRSKAFFLPSDHFEGYISINLKGREPHGVVQPGKEYNDLCRRICHELKRLVNPGTQASAVRDAFQISDFYRGENLQHLPDIVIRWAGDGAIRELYHPDIGLINAQYDGLRKSQHAEYGFLLAAGNHIKKGAVLNGATIMDLAPTMLYLLGQEVPTEVDGKVLFDLIEDDYRREHAPRYANTPLSMPEEIAP